MRHKIKKLLKIPVAPWVLLELENPLLHLIPKSNFSIQEALADTILKAVRKARLIQTMVQCTTPAPVRESLPEHGTDEFVESVAQIITRIGTVDHNNRQCTVEERITLLILASKLEGEKQKVAGEKAKTGKLQIEPQRKSPEDPDQGIGTHYRAPSKWTKLKWRTC
ncbi:hypothetical protein K469DRAFT_690873 [Zopfia rhizophila CBS 207.26]|uniref:Uncharacterized protein n=1 Tax=Zopfia rhizophila CBS 207.26 TaxID=1314779 RepID=A0A6A6DWQ0_9PEZI|nr:hypothetical protein K469DRAFT_690873 [Zopfia rhizophila CBS 207.26]